MPVRATELTGGELVISPDDVITNARSALGVPFVEQGRSPEEGFDCNGLVIWSLLQAGWEPLQPELTLDRHYRVNGSDGRLLQQVVEAECVRVTTPLRPADIVLIRWKPDSPPMHCALVWKTDPLYIIHTGKHTMRVCEHRLEAHKLWQLHSAWRIRSMC